MARNEHVVIRSACVTVLVMSVLWTTVYMSGPVIALLKADIEPNNTAMIWAANNVMPTMIGAVLLAGIVAAGLSSASTFLTLTGFALSNDVISSESADDARRLRLSRITILGVSIVALGLSMVFPPDVFWITYFVATMFAAVWGPVAFMSVWSKRITESGAFWGLVSGFVFYSVPKALTLAKLLYLPAWLDPLVIGFLVSLVTIILVSSRTSVTPEEIAYRESLHRPPEELRDAKAASRTLIWPKILIAWGLVSAGVLCVIYARPYQLATGAVTASSPYLVWTGELVLALLFGLTFSLGGIFALWALKRFHA